MYTKWLVAGILAIGVGFHHMKPALAQGHATHHKAAGAQQDIHQVMMAISITPAQMESIHTIMEKHFRSLDTIKADRSLTDAQIKQRVLAVRQQTETNLTKVFSAEQLRVLNTKGGVSLLLDQKHANPFEMLLKLNLTQEQTARFKGIIAETHRQMAAIKEDKTLSPEERKLKLEQLHQQTFQSIHAILTPEQMKKLQEMHSGDGSKAVPQPHH